MRNELVRRAGMSSVHLSECLQVPGQRLHSAFRFSSAFLFFHFPFFSPKYIVFFFSFPLFHFPPFPPIHQSLLSHHLLSQLSLASLPLLCLLCVSPSFAPLPFVSLPLLYLSPFRRHTGAIGCIPRFRFRNSNEWTLTAFPSPPSLRLILCKYFVAQLHNKREALPLAKIPILLRHSPFTRRHARDLKTTQECETAVIGMS